MMTEADFEKIRKRLSDQEWRLDNLYYIVDKRGQKVKFKRNKSQIKLWKNLWYLNVILKDRQRGFSTFIAIMALDSCLFNSDYAAGIIDLNLSDAKKKLGKIRYAYENLPAALKAVKPLKTDSKESLAWENGSNIHVGTSHRGGTLQFLHISELGKIAAKYPDKAQEIRNGALNTVAPGQMVFVESTAEGQSGDFYEICQEAEAMQIEQRKLTQLDFKFHFFGWLEESDANELDPAGVVIASHHQAYFEKLQVEQGVTISPRQRAWYVKKENQQKGDMKKEYPATPKEAFEAAIEGGIFTKEIAIIRRNQQLRRLPIEPNLAVNTYWDLGVNDNMSIWFEQQAIKEHRFINYYENSGEGFGFYARILREFADEHGIFYGTHFGPHDIDVRNLGATAKTRKERAAAVGIKFVTVARPAIKNDAIHASRNVLPICWFDEERCAVGFKHLSNYRRVWKAEFEVWSSEPRKGPECHAADAFSTFSLARERGDLLSYDPVIVRSHKSAGPQQRRQAMANPFGSLYR